jgi:hypothetical protein
MVYPEISLECKRIANQTAGDWFWEDEGEPVQTLPPCQVLQNLKVSFIEEENRIITYEVHHK